MSAAAPAGPTRPAPPPPLVPPGLLFVDKPTGVTSHDVVERARRRLRARGAGHLGTLDPAASGLLILATGAATRCVSVWQVGAKTYEGIARLGLVTSTQDTQGDVLERRPVRVSEPEVREAALALVGEIDQIPPMVSALKRGGERLYEIARRGETVEREPRRVRVESWEWLGFEFPDVSFRVRVSGGTYVRTLAHDLGARLGCGAALASLRRTRSEPYALERAVTLDELEALPASEVWSRAGLPLDDALAVLPAIALEPAEAEAIGFGLTPRRSGAPFAPEWISAGPRSLVFRDAEGVALALGEIVTDPAETSAVRLRAHVVFPWAVREGRP